MPSARIGRRTGCAHVDGTSTHTAMQPFKYGAKELDMTHGWHTYDFGARIYDPTLARWLSPDPMMEKYYPWSPYVYCGNDPVNAVDPNGRDWYQNNETKYYTWFDGKSAREGFTYIGGKGSVLGEFESIIDGILCEKEGLGLESLYSEGFTFDIAPNDKGGLIGSEERGWDFFDEFISGSGPEFSVVLEDHPYIMALKNEKTVLDSQDVIRKRGANGSRTNVKRKAFYPWQVAINSPMQFIGKYRYDGFTSKDGKYINNVVTDSKSCTSLFYHFPGVVNHRRSQGRELGSTYQFYIWRTKK